jgi:hypothetical protein
MSSPYIKCDGCGAVIDRQPNGDVFGKCDSHGVRSYATSMGWIISDQCYIGEDYCGSCRDRLAPIADEYRIIATMIADLQRQQAALEDEARRLGVDLLTSPYPSDHAPRPETPAYTAIPPR